MQILSHSVEQQEDDALLKAFIDLGDHCPKFLRSQLDNVVELMLKVWAYIIVVYHVYTRVISVTHS